MHFHVTVCTNGLVSSTSTRLTGRTQKFQNRSRGFVGRLCPGEEEEGEEGSSQGGGPRAGPCGRPQRPRFSAPFLQLHVLGQLLNTCMHFATFFEIYKDSRRGVVGSQIVRGRNSPPSPLRGRGQVLLG